jgi:uncharacterized protein
MSIIEPHIHMFSRTTDDYERMSLCGIKVVVEPSFWLGSDRSSPTTFYDYFNHLLTVEPSRSKEFLIQHFTCIGVNPKEANNLQLALKVIEGMERYLDHPRCLAVGEIGFNKITDAEEEVMRHQIALAKKKDMLVMIHLPHTNKKAGVERTIKVLLEEKIDPQRVLIDHNTEETIEAAINYGGWLGFTIYPGKMTAERFINLIKKYGSNRVMINSSADWGPSDPLSVPKTIYSLQHAGFSEDKIRKITWENPFNFYTLSGKFKI